MWSIERTESASLPGRFLPLVIAVGLLAGVFAPIGAAAQSDDLRPKFPRVIWLEDPAHSATIVWMTKEKGRNHAIYYDTEPHKGNVEEYDHALNPQRTIPESGDHAWFHHALLEDLEPSAKYWFVVETDGQTSQEYHFETAPADDRPFKLMYGGDSRSDRKNRQNVNDFLRERFSGDDSILALVHGGDYIASAVVWDQWVAWMEDWMRTTTRQGQLLPIVPGRGNHEFSLAGLDEQTDNYNAVFGIPGGEELDYWTTEFGAHTAFITLDTNSTLGGDQREWLESQLTKHTGERRWILANYHRPAYPAVKSAGAARTHWVPLFEKYNVDLVCESDGHVLKRTVPIRDGEQAADGIVYVGEGGLGVKQRTPDERWYLEEPGMAMSAHHIQLLSFGPDELGYKALTLDGSVVDQKTFEPRRQVEPVPLGLEAVDVQEPTRLHVELTKGLKAETVDTDDFAFEAEVAISEAQMHDNFDDTVVLTTAPLQKGNSYTLTASAMKDLLGHDIEADASLTFTYGVQEADPTDAPDADTGGEDAGGESDESDSQEMSNDEPSEATTKSGCSVGGTTPPSPAGLAFLVIAAVWLRRKRN